MKKIFIIIVTSMIILIVFYEENFYLEKDYDFVYKKELLKGKLIIPKGKESEILLVFIHGDGAMPYDAFGYYTSLWNNLAKSGISSYSWNKKGINGSKGNWLHQSMEDRAEETIIAIKKLKKEKKFKKIGIIGFSQAGWVLPLISKIDEIQDFSILVSPAINWLEQKRFYEKNHTDKNLIVSDDRKIFIEKNKESDSKNKLKYIKKPLLLLLAKDDKNINIENTKKIFEEKLSSNLFVKVFQEAEHSMLKTKYFNEEKKGIITIVKMLFLQEEAFTPNYFSSIITWVKKNK